MVLDEAISLVVYTIAAVLVAIGTYGLTSTRNLLRMLLSVEVMFNGILLGIVAYLSFDAVLDTLASIIIVSVVSGEVIVVVAILVSFYRIARTFDSTALEEEVV